MFVVTDVVALRAETDISIANVPIIKVVVVLIIASSLAEGY
jgi:hypothetical protein